MDWGLQGKTALVTGASQGIGRTTAKLLAMEGVTVVAVARRIELIEQLAREVAPGVGKIIPLAVDFSVDGESERAAKEAERLLGHVDILINAAGGSRPVPFDATKEQWLEGMTLNFWQPINYPSFQH
jgi:3-oxoacyl-[acyl-carrier protein] reductase